MDLVCPICSKEYQKGIGHYNRAVKLNAKLYCSKTCFAIGRKLEFDRHLKTTEQLKSEKADYDIKRRNGVLREAILEEKKKYYYDNKEIITPKLKAYRDKNMYKHVEYCRDPEYKKWKSNYDQQYLAQKRYGDFAECAILLRQIEGYIDKRMIKQEKGLTNKSQKRKRQWKN